MARLVDAAFQASEGSNTQSYPPYNIERTGETDIRISLAVAGFAPDELSVTIEDTQLVIRGKQDEDPDREFLHRGIAARRLAGGRGLAGVCRVQRIVVPRANVCAQMPPPRPGGMPPAPGGMQSPGAVLAAAVLRLRERRAVQAAAHPLRRAAAHAARAVHRPSQLRAFERRQPLPRRGRRQRRW